MRACSTPMIWPCSICDIDWQLLSLCLFSHFSILSSPSLLPSLSIPPPLSIPLRLYFPPSFLPCHRRWDWWYQTARGWTAGTMSWANWCKLVSPMTSPTSWLSTSTEKSQVSQGWGGRRGKCVHVYRAVSFACDSGSSCTDCILVGRG